MFVEIINHMRKIFLFAINFLYILHFVGLLNIISILPSNNSTDVNYKDVTLFFWIVFIISVSTYIIFLRGINYLRISAKFLLSRKPFSEEITSNLKKSGKHFLITGILALFLIIFIVFDSSLYAKLLLSIDLIGYLFLVAPLFLMIIGMFLLIQSEMLLIAKNLKSENELTI